MKPEETVGTKASKQEMERRRKVLEEAKKLPQAKNVVKLSQGKSYDFDEIKRNAQNSKNKKNKYKNN